MTTKRRHLVEIVRDDAGQSWVETVVMLPVLVLILLGLFYFKGITGMRMQAVEAARYVTWETTWFAREDRPDVNDVVRPPKDEATFKDELRKIGLGFGLQKVTLKQRPLSTYMDDVEPSGSHADAQPTLFLPQAFGDLLGGQVGSGDGFLGSLSGAVDPVVNELFGVIADVAVPIHEIFAYQVNWRGETDRAVHTVKVEYDFRTTGMFERFGTVDVNEFSSVLSHPYAIARVKKDEDGDKKEYIALVGDPDAICDSGGTTFGEGNGRTAHVFDLWIFPTGGMPSYTPVIGGLSGVFNVVGDVISLVKNIPCGAGGLLSQLNFLGGNIDFKMPDGTLKEYPELRIDNSSSSGDSSGSGLGSCENGGGGIGSGCG